MHGDFSRWTFDAAQGYRSVLLQQGRVLLDAEANEQATITAYHDETRTLDIVGRAGGPLDGAGWAIVGTGGGAPSATHFADLRLTPGRYYVDGILVEAPAVPGAPGYSLADQPFLRRIGDLPGLTEPAADGRYALVLDVFAHHVTPDERPALLESALGGVDTATRVRTVWQARLVALPESATCVDVTDALIAPAASATMTASLVPPAPEDDPCRITTSGGYQLLENQLYRVQVHDVDAGTGAARYLWSRENGSVVAKLAAIGPATAATHDNVLTVDRAGRDEELSIGDGDLVEVTSVDRQLSGLSGYLAHAVAPSGLDLPVRWVAGAPTSVTALGGTPLVRRWEGGPASATAATDALEGGIRVRFAPGAGRFRVGDYWEIPARTVRLVCGVSALSGTIEWPTDGGGNPLPQPPLGVRHHVAALAVLQRTTSDGGVGQWTLVGDCRHLFPPLTSLLTLDLLGGDGQEAPPGEPLPERIRVVVRNGGVAVAGAQVRFTTTGGSLAPGNTVPVVGGSDSIVVTTDVNGYAETRWRLDDSGPATQTLTAVRLDPAGHGTGAEVRVTGHRDTGDGACVVLGPNANLVQVLDDLSGVSSLVLCLLPGDYLLPTPAILTRVGNVRVEGSGPGTRLVSSAESALRFEDCANVVVRDLYVESRGVRDAENLAGALAITRARDVAVDRVWARVHGGPTPMASGISVTSQRPGDRDHPQRMPESRVVITDCKVEVGDRQTGILVVDAARADIVRCDVSAWRTPGSVTEATFDEWLKEPEFARLVARRAIAGVGPGDPDLGLRAGYAWLVEGVADHPFGTEIVNGDNKGADAAGWREYIAATGIKDVADLQTKVRDDLVTANQQSRFYNERTLFARWRKGIATELAATAVADRGIVVAGWFGGEVRITDCVVLYAMEGIVTALSDSDAELEKVWRVLLRGNRIVPPHVAPVGFIEHGVYVGNVEILHVHDNEITGFATRKYALVGVYLPGQLGQHAVVSANTFRELEFGIQIPGHGAPGEGTPAEPPHLRIARDNICNNDHVVLDDLSHTWLSENNVP